MYSDKMVKVEPKQIALTDKLIETRNNKASFQIDALSSASDWLIFKKIWMAKSATWLVSIWKPL